MPLKEDFISDRIETILSLLDKSPGNICRITPERDELFEGKYKAFRYHSTIDLLEPLTYLQNEDSILQEGYFQEKLTQLKRISIPNSEDNHRLETIKQKLNDLIDEEIRTLLEEIKNKLELDLINPKKYLLIDLIMTMESDLISYQSRYDQQEFEKNDIKSIDDYATYIDNLKWFAGHRSRKIYCYLTPVEVEDDARFEEYRDKWKSELSLFEGINADEINDDQKYQLLQIGLEQTSEEIRATQDSLIAAKNKLLPQLQKYCFLEQLPHYIFGEVVQEHILLNSIHFIINSAI